VWRAQSPPGLETRAAADRKRFVSQLVAVVRIAFVGQKPTAGAFKAPAMEYF